MNAWTLLIPILLPIIGGGCLYFFPVKNEKVQKTYIMSLVILNSLIVYTMLILGVEGTCRALTMAHDLTIHFHIDGFSKVFAGIIAGLWPLATLYAFEYMKHEERNKLFFSFYTITYGVCIGIAFAANLMTLYMFYELLTLSTLTLVIHKLDQPSIVAARKYMVYSFAGAAFAFIGFMFLLHYGTTTDFVYGGVLDMTKVSGQEDILLFIFVIAVLGFGVKAAIFPFHGWLPTASVAPTPVTALLHAVAVVKAGAFAIIRITYYSFGTDFLRGTWAQTTIMFFAIVTILFASSRAVKEIHLKRRLAYSTISNLSYIVFSASIMTPYGLEGSMAHMVTHAVMKITLFFCAGAIMHQTGKEYIYELKGIGKSMPFIMTCFTIGSAAVMGVPMLCGFVSKWTIITAAVKSQNPYAFIGIAAILFSAFLTAVYLFSIVVKAFFRTEKLQDPVENQDPNWYMKVPICLLTGILVVIGVYSGPLMRFLGNIAFGRI
ncbi:MAG: proton-conducting transporter membrane subunit [Lachnospiraceae bacterium]|nr:proton-conducting transporter membrane subunit [Lachnospiraceae bacterium]